MAAVLECLGAHGGGGCLRNWRHKPVPMATRVMLLSRSVSDIVTTSAAADPDDSPGPCLDSVTYGGSPCRFGWPLWLRPPRCCSFRALPAHRSCRRRTFR